MNKLVPLRAFQLFLLLINLYLTDGKKKKKPNVMIILADDVGTGDVPGYFNTSFVDMPNLGHLLATGTTFIDAHSTPKCAPSRYVLLSGQYQHRGSNYDGTWTMNYKNGQFKHHQQSIARVFRDNGYHTSMFGKWHLGGIIPRNRTFDAGSYDEKTKLSLSYPGHAWQYRLKQGPWDLGFDHSYVTICGVHSPPYAFLRNGKFQEKDLSNVTYWNDGSFPMPEGISRIISEGEGANDWDSTAYNMILVKETENFLDKHMKIFRDKPFFTYVALGAVHRPHSPPFKYIDGFPVAGKYDTKHMDVLGEVDLVVGSLFKMLEDRKLIEDTIIVFASDNGGIQDVVPSKTGHNPSGRLREAKGSIYEGGHRIPMTLRWDKGKIPKGETRSHLVGLNDLYATLCDFAGIEIPEGQAIDSISFADYALNQDKKQGLREYLPTWEMSNNKLVRAAIRKGSMKLIRDYRSKEFELYNLTADISEMNDISEGNEELIDAMFEKLKEFRFCYDNKFLFKVKKRGTNIIRKMHCSWLGEDPASRCPRFVDSQFHCGNTCAPGNLNDATRHPCAWIDS